MKRVPLDDGSSSVAAPSMSPFSSLFRVAVFLDDSFVQKSDQSYKPRLTRALPSSIKSTVSSSDCKNWAKPIDDRHRVPSLYLVLHILKFKV